MLGETIQLSAADGNTFDAYLAEPDGKPKAGLVVIQEIFGITDHIRRVTDDYAARGYKTIAPSLFDRVQPGTVLEYSAVDQGRELMMQLNPDGVIADVTAAVDAVRMAGKVGAVGYCWGGAIADLAACRAGIDAAAAYYGRMIVEWLELQPACPVIYHFGEADPLIPMETVAQIEAGRPAGVFRVYAGAGHGFNCNDRDDYHSNAADLALERTLQFFENHLT